MPLFRWDGARLHLVGISKLVFAAAAGSYIAAVGAGQASYDWSANNPPHTYSDPSVLTAKWPAGVQVVDLQTGSADFHTNLTNTVNAAGSRVVVRLGEAVYHLDQFRLIGSSGDPTYAFGFWLPNLRGFLGQGPNKTVIQMDADSMSAAQLTKMKSMMASAFSPLQMGLCRIDGSPSSPILLAGLTFRADDQQLLTQVGSDVPANVPQPAPHQGVVLYSGHSTVGSYVRFQGAGRASTSAPPFEMGNVSTQYGTASWDHCEFDGRRAVDLDPAQPRRCGPYMGNNETLLSFTDCYFHHTNVSRYAVNDENRATQGVYSLTRCKLEQITNTHNVDPVYGALNGYTNATSLGWESCNGTITVTDCIISQDNSFTDRQIAQHLQLTSVGGRNPQGGRLTVSGGTFINNGFPSIDGFLCIRAITSTFWVSDGYDTTMDIRSSSGVRKSAYVIGGSWPPSAASLASANIRPDTHYLVRNS